MKLADLSIWQCTTKFVFISQHKYILYGAFVTITVIITNKYLPYGLLSTAITV